MRAFLERLRPLAPLTLRLALGAIFAYYGFHKVHGGLDKFTAAVTGFGFPKWSAQLAAWTELVGGALLVVGFLTRPAAAALAGVMVVALWKVKLHSGFSGGIEFPMLCLAACLSVLLSGAGRLSLDRRLFGGA